MSGQGSGGNVIAALCNIFIPGLGQLIQGRIMKALLFFVVVWIMYGIGWFSLGLTFIIGGLFHLWAIIDAAKFKASS